MANYSWLESQVNAYNQSHIKMLNLTPLLYVWTV